MSKNEVKIKFPIGRLVQGSLYDPITTDSAGAPLIVKTGINAGKPAVKYYINVAIAKTPGETHWSQTEWGKQIYAIGQAGFPNGQWQLPTFAWKVTDGDSSIPNKAGNKPVEKEGHAGHWILNFSTYNNAPRICNADGSEFLLEKNYVNLGDYIQVYGAIADNESAQSPGIFLNHLIVAFAGYGQRISFLPDPKSIGFGGQLPPGASSVPLSAAVPPTVVAPLAPPVPPAAPVMPYPQILTPPAPVAAPVKVMTALAQGTYEQYIAQGWTDALLIQHGFMQA